MLTGLRGSCGRSSLGQDQRALGRRSRCWDKVTWHPHVHSVWSTLRMLTGRWTHGQASGPAWRTLTERQIDRQLLCMAVEQITVRLIPESHADVALGFMQGFLVLIFSADSSLIFGDGTVQRCDYARCLESNHWG